MKIKKRGNEWKRLIHCDYKESDFECNCGFEVKFDDLIKERIEIPTENSVEFMNKFYVFYIHCPNCNQKILITDPPTALFAEKMFNEGD